MTDVKELTEKIMQTTLLLNSEEIPDIGLYMDQVTTLLENNLNFLDRPESERVLTKTMINNYTKSNILPSPEKKKYTKDHILLLSFIYYFKTVLSIGDIKKLTTPLKDDYFHNKGSLSLEEIYKTVSAHASKSLDDCNKDILKKIESSKNTFTDVPQEDMDTLQMLSLISSLSYDIFIKKYLIESLIKSMDKEDLPEEKQKKETKKKK